MPGKPLISTLHDQPMRVRQAAVEGLCQISDRMAVEPLIGAVHG